jgi:hypothetical protein
LLIPETISSVILGLICIILALAHAFVHAFVSVNFTSTLSAFVHAFVHAISCDSIFFHFVTSAFVFVNLILSVEANLILFIIVPISSCSNGLRVFLDILLI